MYAAAVAITLSAPRNQVVTGQFKASSYQVVFPSACHDHDHDQIKSKRPGPEDDEPLLLYFLVHPTNVRQTWSN